MFVFVCVSVSMMRGVKGSGSREPATIATGGWALIRTAAVSMFLNEN